MPFKFQRRTIAGFISGILLVAVTGCQTTPPEVSSSAVPPPSDRRFNATLWFQSAEASAAYLQTFAFARQALDIAIRESPSSHKPLAIVTDIDETVLDNSAYQSQLIRKNEPYNTNTWKRWTAMACAPALAGASNFLHYATNRGVEVLYVTNRDLDESEGTLKNLRAAGLPQATAGHVFFNRTTRSKEDRRQEIAQRYSVCLLLGDNLSDLAVAFDSKLIEERAAAVQTNAAQFGARWIVFPNPMYGDWESAKQSSGTNALQERKLK